MKIFPSITSFNENLSQLNAWGIDSDELTHLVDKHGVLTDVLNETRDSIELVFRNPDT